MLVEKPLTRHRTRRWRLIDTAAAGNRVLMVDHTFVYTPAVRTIRNLVAAASSRLYYYDSGA